MNLCPFRKEIIMTDYKYGNGYPVDTVHKEYFLECLGKKCMAWKEDKDIAQSDQHKRCKLIDK